jgi:hypothetical protein
MATITIPGLVPEPTPSLLHWNKAQMDDTGRFLIVRNLRPRKWILYDMNFLSIDINTPQAPRIAVFQTRREALAFIANLVAVRPNYAPVFINTPISATLLPVTPSPVWTA